MEYKLFLDLENIGLGNQAPTEIQDYYNLNPQQHQVLGSLPGASLQDFHHRF